MRIGTTGRIGQDLPRAEEHAVEHLLGRVAARSRISALRQSAKSRADVIAEAILLADRDGGRERAAEAVRAKVAEGLDAIDAGDVHPGDRVFDELLG